MLMFHSAVLEDDGYNAVYNQWQNETKYTYSSTVLKDLKISILSNVILHSISQANIECFTPLLTALVTSYFSDYTFSNPFCPVTSMYLQIW